VLDCATLEIVKLGQAKKDAAYHLLNSDDHQSVLRKHGRDISSYRPDITHQCLLTLLDSPLNKAGKLQVYIRTEGHQLIEVNPQTRIPRTYSRFAGLMVQLLHKLSIKAVGSTERLLHIIRNPLTDHLPVGAPRVGLSGDAPVIQLPAWIKEQKKGPIVFFIGAMAHGEDKFEDVEQKIGISEFPLAASTVCSRICHSFEQHWDIL